METSRAETGHPDALALAAGELGREAVVVLGVEPDHLHQLLNPLLALLAVGDAVDVERVADDRPDPLARVQRRVRVLEDHLDLAPECPQRATLEGGDVVAVELDGALGDWQQLGDQPRQGRLAAAGLTHHAERLARVDLQVDAVDRVHPADLALEDDPLGDREVLLHAGEPDQRLACLGARAHRAGATSCCQMRSLSSRDRWQADRCSGFSGSAGSSLGTSLVHSSNT
jgi:hypothetical protein